MKEGVFWLVGKDGIEPERGEIISRFGRDVAHVNAWEEVKRENPKLKKYDYEYFPRGRIFKVGEKAIVFIDPRLNREEILRQVREIFEIDCLEEVALDR